MEYSDFEILITPDHHIRASAQQGEATGTLRLDINQIRLALQLVEKRNTNEKLLKGLGDKLYQAIFPTRVRDIFKASMAGAEIEERGLRLRLIIEPADIQALPWEFLYEVETNTFLANSIQTPVSRYIPVPMRKRDIRSASLPLKILIVISDPSDLPPLDAENEERLIREALTRRVNEGQVVIDTLTPATIRGINQKLREKPYNVFHFIGHAMFDGADGRIALQDDDETARSVDEELFSNFFLGNRTLGLVVLNACQGAATSEHQALVGIAPRLVQRGIPAVVAMRYPIRDITAKYFSDEFYRTLALGWPVDAAIQTSRNAISIEAGLGLPDFATPVLFMRAEDGTILSGL